MGLLSHERRRDLPSWLARGSELIPALLFGKRMSAKEPLTAPGGFFSPSLDGGLPLFELFNSSRSSSSAIRAFKAAFLAVNAAISPLVLPWPPRWAVKNYPILESKTAAASRKMDRQFNRDRVHKGVHDRSVPNQSTEGITAQASTQIHQMLPGKPKSEPGLDPLSGFRKI